MRRLYSNNRLLFPSGKARSEKIFVVERAEAVRSDIKVRCEEAESNRAKEIEPATFFVCIV